MPFGYFISVLIHILAAVVWLGGMFFLILVLIPVFRKPEHKSIFPTLFHLVGVRYRFIGWISLIIMIVTGTINLGYRGFGVSDLLSGSLFLGTFGKILLQKLIVVAIILLLSILHDFWIGPLATSLIRKDPLSPKSTKYRRIASWLGRINFIMAIIVVALAVTLVRGGH